MRTQFGGRAQSLYFLWVWRIRVSLNCPWFELAHHFNRPTCCQRRMQCWQNMQHSIWLIDVDPMYWTCLDFSCHGRRGPLEVEEWNACCAKRPVTSSGLFPSLSRLSIANVATFSGKSQTWLWSYFLWIRICMWPNSCFQRTREFGTDIQPRRLSTSWTSIQAHLDVV